MAIIDDFLKEVVIKGGSDLHFVTGAKPMIRLNGRLIDLRDDVVKYEEGKTILMEILSPTLMTTASISGTQTSQIMITMVLQISKNTIIIQVQLTGIPMGMAQAMVME